MATRTVLLDKLKTVQELAESSKIRRFLHNPLRYVRVIGFDRLVYPRRPLPLIVSGEAFYGMRFNLGLPAGADIYLTGGKTHISEIRLSRFMLRHFKPTDSYVDVGGHYGFFAGLASKILEDGEVTVFEPAPNNFKYLHDNLKHTDANLQQAGLADKEGKLTFYQFPARYSEYNSLDVAQYEGEEWFAKYPPEAVEVPITTLDAAFPIAPDWLKIDVEGAEDRVVQGGRNMLAQGKTVVSMEYLSAASSNGSHKRAHQLMKNQGYATYRLNDDGIPIPCPDPETFMKTAQQDSANLIFAKELPKPIV